MTGAMPMTISTTFEVSPRPKTMNRIGRSASGGITQTTATKGAQRSARTRGMKPMAMPSDKADQRGDADAGEQPAQARRGVGPQEEVAGALVRLDRQLQEGRRHLRGERQQLVGGLSAQPRRRRDR